MNLYAYSSSSESVSCSVISDRMDSGFSVHGILQGRILEWVATCMQDSHSSDLE